MSAPAASFERAVAVPVRLGRIGWRLTVDRAESEREIRRVEGAYDAAWQRGDIDALVEHMVEDVVLVNPRGKAACGLAEVRRELGAFLSGEGARSTHHSSIERIAFASDDVAIVDGQATVQRIDGDDPGSETIVHGFTDVLVRTGGRWLIAHVRAYARLRP